MRREPPACGRGDGVIALAWRNLWRQRRRSLTTAAAVGVVVWIAILFYSFGGAFRNSFYQDITESVGHVQVNPTGYRDAVAFSDSLLRDAAPLRRTLQALAPEAAVVGVVQVPALVAGDERSRGALVVGQDWPRDLRATFTGRHLADGSFVTDGDLRGIVLGRSLADALELTLGDPVAVYAPGTEGLGASAYQLVGLVTLDDPSQEAGAAYLSLAAAQELAAPGAVQRFELHLPDLRQISSDARTAALAGRLGAALPSGVSVETWRAVDPTLVALMNAMNPVLYGMSLLFFALAGLLVVNTVYLSLIERVREFGLILALGAGGGQVIRMIVTESVLLCLTGAVVGAAVGLGMVALLAPGFTMPGFEGLYAAMGMNPVLYPSVTPGQVGFAFGFAVLTAVAAALWPASLAARIEPVEAMRYTA